MYRLSLDMNKLEICVYCTLKLVIWFPTCCTCLTEWFRLLNGKMYANCTMVQFMTLEGNSESSPFLSSSSKRPEP